MEIVKVQHSSRIRLTGQKRDPLRRKEVIYDGLLGCTRLTPLEKYRWWLRDERLYREWHRS